MEEQKIDFSVSEEVAQGTYANLAVITHSNSEFILDFIAMMPGVPKANVRSRIILTPQNAKRLLHALTDNIRKFEEKAGKISEVSPDVLPMVNPNKGGMA